MPAAVHPEPLQHDGMTRHRAAVVVPLVTVTVTLAVSGAVPAVAAPVAPQGFPPDPSGRTVTLVTGDRVSVGAGGRIAIAAGPGRAGTTFLTRRVGTHVSVIPADAVPLLHAGRLDRRLFDVTTLLSFGYDRRASLPLIVSGTAPMTTATRALPAVNGYAMAEPRADAGTFWAALTRTTATVWLDGLRQPSLDVSVPQIGAPAAWQAGYTGAGQLVAVLDTGIDATHPDLSDAVVAERNFTEGAEDGLDHVGHGTHVASIITGSGAASGGRYKGVAPDAHLLDGKVCTAGGCAESWILAGMQWAMDQHAKVVNMSLGGPDTPDVDPVEQAVDSLSQRYGALFVVSAGNNGPDAQTVTSPGSADAALTVAAVDKSGQLASFSSRGPRTGDFAMKPDIAAPGVDITAARGRDASVGTPGNPYVTLSGTSMAAPHVTGAAAILAQEHPDWSGARLKAALMASAQPLPGIDVFGQGAGRVDVAREIHQSVVSTPVSVGFGMQSFPHTDDVPVTVPVSYHNDGTVPVTLTLTTPSNVFSVSPAAVTVPAGGDASVSVTADTRVASPDGFLGGNLTATAAGVTVATPLGVYKEPESYNLTIRHLDRAGAPTTRYDTLVENLDRLDIRDLSGGADTVTVRLPKGRYVVSSILDPDPDTWIELARPELVLDHDQTLVVDARKAAPMSVTVPRASAKPLYAEVGFLTIQSPDLGYGSSLIVASFGQLYSGQLGPDRKVPQFVSKVDGGFADPGPAGDFVDSPHVYALTWFTQGRMVTGVTKHLHATDLAAVRQEFDSPLLTGTASVGSLGSIPGRYDGGFSVTLPVRAPFTRTEYFTADSGLMWATTLSEPDYVAQLNGLTTAYRAGRSYTETWDRGVFGPTMPDRQIPRQYVSRTGDVIGVDLWLFGDSANHLGTGNTSTARTTLTRDGVLVGRTDAAGAGSFPVPAAPGRYRLETRVTRDVPLQLTTSLSAAWTFTSGHAAGDAPVVLPLSVVRFLPPLDGYNTSRPGRKVTIPVEVDRQAGAVPARLCGLTVDVSTDDGRTWTRLRVDVGTVTVTNPTRPGFVSLRASATDADGNTVEETIIHAYRVG